MQRRLLLSGAGAVSMVSLCGCGQTPVSRGSGGCFVNAQSLNSLVDGRNPRFGSISVDDPMIGFSGDREFDRALGRQLVRLAATFRVNPAFAYVDDRLDRNAIASPSTRVRGTWGTVLFGINFMRSILSGATGGDIAVLGVCAHEFAHIFQFRTGYFDRLQAMYYTSKPYELHADFLAGYFVGLTKAMHPSITLDALHDSFYRMGTYDARDPDFHGTPAERAQAITLGIRSATSGLSLDGVAQRAFSFATSSAILG